MKPLDLARDRIILLLDNRLNELKCQLIRNKNRINELSEEQKSIKKERHELIQLKNELLKKLKST
jgi:hypothetical protein